MERLLEKVKDFAARAHGEQTRKYSTEKYIVHPIRVMERCQKYTSSVPVLAAALLHDVLEDSEVTVREMQDFLATIMDDKDAAYTTGLVVELTDIYTKSVYPGWNRRRRKTREAERIEQTTGESQTIKYADIIDNCREIAVRDPSFAALFLQECKKLLKKIPKGNPDLYQEAIDAVIHGLKLVPDKFKRHKR